MEKNRGISKHKKVVAPTTELPKYIEVTYGRYKCNSEILSKLIRYKTYTFEDYATCDDLSKKRNKKYFKNEYKKCEKDLERMKRLANQVEEEKKLELNKVKIANMIAYHYYKGSTELEFEKNEELAYEYLSKIKKIETDFEEKEKIRKIPKNNMNIANLKFFKDNKDKRKNDFLNLNPVINSGCYRMTFTNRRNKVCNYYIYFSNPVMLDSYYYKIDLLNDNTEVIESHSIDDFISEMKDSCEITFNSNNFGEKKFTKNDFVREINEYQSFVRKKGFYDLIFSSEKEKNETVVESFIENFLKANMKMVGLYNLAFSYENGIVVERNLDKAIYYYKQVINNIEDKVYNKLYCKTCNNLAIIYCSKGCLKEAIDCFKEAYKYGDKIAKINLDYLLGKKIEENELSNDKEINEVRNKVDEETEIVPLEMDCIQQPSKPKKQLTISIKTAQNPIPLKPELGQTPVQPAEKKDSKSDQTPVQPPKPMQPAEKEGSKSSQMEKNIQNLSINETKQQTIFDFKKNVENIYIKPEEKEKLAISDNNETNIDIPQEITKIELSESNPVIDIKPKEQNLKIVKPEGNNIDIIQEKNNKHLTLETNNAIFSRNNTDSNLTVDNDVQNFSINERGIKKLEITNTEPSNISLKERENDTNLKLENVQSFSINTVDNSYLNDFREQLRDLKLENEEINRKNKILLLMLFEIPIQILQFVQELKEIDKEKILDKLRELEEIKKVIEKQKIRIENFNKNIVHLANVFSERIRAFKDNKNKLLKKDENNFSLNSENNSDNIFEEYLGEQILDLEKSAQQQLEDNEITKEKIEEQIKILKLIQQEENNRNLKIDTGVQVEKDKKYIDMSINTEKNDLNISDKNAYDFSDQNINMNLQISEGVSFNKFETNIVNSDTMTQTDDNKQNVLQYNIDDSLNNILTINSKVNMTENDTLNYNEISDKVVKIVQLFINYNYRNLDREDSENINFNDLVKIKKLEDILNLTETSFNDLIKIINSSYQEIDNASFIFSKNNFTLKLDKLYHSYQNEKKSKELKTFNRQLGLKIDAEEFLGQFKDFILGSDSTGYVDSHYFTKRSLQDGINFDYNKGFVHENTLDQDFDAIINITNAYNIEKQGENSINNQQNYDYFVEKDTEINDDTNSSSENKNNKVMFGTLDTGSLNQLNTRASGGLPQKQNNDFLTTLNYISSLYYLTGTFNGVDNDNISKTGFSVAFLLNTKNNENQNKEGIVPSLKNFSNKLADIVYNAEKLDITEEEYKIEAAKNEILNIINPIVIKTNSNIEEDLGKIIEKYIKNRNIDKNNEDDKNKEIIRKENLENELFGILDNLFIEEAANIYVDNNKQQNVDVKKEDFFKGFKDNIDKGRKYLQQATLNNSMIQQNKEGLCDDLFNNISSLIEVDNINKRFDQAKFDNSCEVLNKICDSVIDNGNINTDKNIKKEDITKEQLKDVSESVYYAERVRNQFDKNNAIKCNNDKATIAIKYPDDYSEEYKDFIEKTDNYIEATFSQEQIRLEDLNSVYNQEEIKEIYGPVDKESIVEKITIEGVTFIIPSDACDWIEINNLIGRERGILPGIIEYMQKIAFLRTGKLNQNLGNIVSVDNKKTINKTSAEEVTEILYKEKLSAIKGSFKGKFSPKDEELLKSAFGDKFVSKDLEYEQQLSNDLQNLTSEIGKNNQNTINVSC